MGDVKKYITLIDEESGESMILRAFTKHELEDLGFRVIDERNKDEILSSLNVIDFDDLATNGGVLDLTIKD